jgi:hypothetical protein
MQTVTTLPVLQAVSDSTDHYLGLQPIIKGRTNAEYVNSNLRFNPSSNTLTLDANLNLRRGSVSLNALSANVLPLTGGTITSDLGVAGNLSFNSGYGSVATAYGCRAWVRFTVTGGTPSIAASGNVTSITDNGVGDYTFNFTNAMPDTNYAFVGLGTGGGANYQIPGGAQGNGTTLSTGSLRTQFGWVSSTSGSLTNQDPNVGYIAIFR